MAMQYNCILVETLRDKYLSTNTNIQRSHTMTHILKKLTKFFTTGHRSDLEKFISNKRPTSTAEVDFWIQQYNQRSMAREM